MIFFLATQKTQWIAGDFFLQLSELEKNKFEFLTSPSRAHAMHLTIEIRTQLEQEWQNRFVHEMEGNPKNEKP